MTFRGGDELFISVTRLHLKGKRKLPVFFWHTIKSIRQAKKAEGHLYSSVDKEGWLTFWTLTIWENEDYMRDYRKKGSHLKAMKVSKDIASELDYINWESEKKTPWDECKKRLNKEVEKDKIKK